VHETPEPPSARLPGLPSWIDAILLTALAKRPENRFPDADAWNAMWRTHAEVDGSRISHAWLRLEPTSGPGSVRGEALAVEGFRDLSGAESVAAADPKLLAQGLTEALRAALARTPGLDVVALAASDGHDELRRERARRAGARRLLSGSLRRIGERVRLSFSLTDLATDVEVAGGTLDATHDELFDLEDRVVAEVLGALRLAARRSETVALPRDPDAHASYLTAMAQLQSPDDEAAVDSAITILEMLRATQPAAASVEAALARAYLKKYQRRSGREQELAAADACQRALTLDPHAGDVLVTLGDLHRSTGHHGEAIEAFQRALGLRPEFYEAWSGLGLALMETGRHEEAEEACRKAIALRPEHAHGYQRLGLLFHRQGRYAQAVEPLRMVIRLEPENGVGHLNLAGAYYQMGRLAEAAEGFRLAIAIKPTAAAFTNLGTVRFDQGLYAEAVEAFEQAVRLKPTDPRFWRNLASASELIRGGRGRQKECLERAVALLTERLEINSNDAEDWIQLAAATADLGQGDRAREAIDRALALAPHDASFHALAGQALNSLGDRDAARSHLIQAIHGGHIAEPLLHNPALAWLESDAEFQTALEARAARGDPP
jgi:serine/threonine-protein kinase